MRFWIFESKRSQFRRYGAMALTDQLIGVVSLPVIQAGIDTHLASKDKELRWFGEGMQQALIKWQREHT